MGGIKDMRENTTGGQYKYVWRQALSDLSLKQSFSASHIATSKHKTKELAFVTLQAFLCREITCSSCIEYGLHNLGIKVIY